MGEYLYRTKLSWSQNQLELSGHSHSPATLSLGTKSIWYPLDGSHSQSGSYGQVNILTLPVLKPQLLNCAANSQSGSYGQVNILTLPVLKPQLLNCAANSQSLYWLCNLHSYLLVEMCIFMNFTTLLTTAENG
jgi:hypothetical protein